MKRIVYLSFVFLLFGIIPVFSQPNRAKLDSSVVRIRPCLDNGTCPVGGTAWFFYSEKFLVTAAHVVIDPSVSKDEWSKVEILHLGKTDTVNVRLNKFLKGANDSLAILELEKPFKGGKALILREEPIKKGTLVYSPAYTSGIYRFTVGKFQRIATAEDEYKRVNLKNLGLFETHEVGTNDRLAIAYGASGAPIVDTRGRVVAIQNRAIIIVTPNGALTSTKVGEYNNAAIMADVLKGFKPNQKVEAIEIKEDSTSLWFNDLRNKGGDSIALYLIPNLPVNYTKGYRELVIVGDSQVEKDFMLKAEDRYNLFSEDQNKTETIVLVNFPKGDGNFNIALAWALKNNLKPVSPWVPYTIGEKFPNLYKQSEFGDRTYIIESIGCYIDYDAFAYSLYWNDGAMEVSLIWRSSFINKGSYWFCFKK